MVPEHDQRRDARSERLRREEAGRRRQLYAAAALTALALVGGIAFALRPGPAPATTPTRPAAVPSAAAVTTEAPATEPAATTVSAGAVVAQEATPAAPVAVAHPPLRPAPGRKTIIIQKKKQMVTVYAANGDYVDSFLCATGKQYPRLGTYKVYGRKWKSYSLYDSSRFYYFVKFVRSDKGNNIGFHSIPQWPSGKLVGGLGKPVSHGCVRLDKAKAKFLYKWARNGTRVIVKR